MTSQFLRLFADGKDVIRRVVCDNVYDNTSPLYNCYADILRERAQVLRSLINDANAEAKKIEAELERAK